MGASRWIGGYLGFILGGGPLGALAGFALGWLFEKGMDNVNDKEGEYGQAFADSYNRQREYEGERRKGGVTRPFVLLCGCYVEMVVSTAVLS